MKILTISALFLSVTLCHAQETQTYYVGEGIRPVSTIDSAVCIRTISLAKSPQNTYAVAEYYLDKTLKKTGNSLTNNFRLRYEGDVVNYYPNGKKLSIEMYKGGSQNGLSTYYFQNDSVRKKVYYFYNDKKEKAEKMIALNDSLGHHFLDKTGTGVYKATNEYGELVEESYLNRERNGTWKVYHPKSKETI